jgi:hypothetical protein
MTHKYYAHSLEGNRPINSIRFRSYLNLKHPLAYWMVKNRLKIARIDFVPVYPYLIPRWVLLLYRLLLSSCDWFAQMDWFPRQKQAYLIGDLQSVIHHHPIFLLNCRIKLDILINLVYTKFHFARLFTSFQSHGGALWGKSRIC